MILIKRIFCYLQKINFSYIKRNLIYKTFDLKLSELPLLIFLAEYQYWDDKKEEEPFTVKSIVNYH